MEEYVEKMKLMYPDKYKKAQALGEDIMSKNYNPTVGQDEDLEKKQYEVLVKAMKDYSLTDDDLTEDEKALLKNVSVAK